MASLILVLCMQSDPADLVRRLGAERVEDREAAAALLADGAAREALWAGAWSGDPEIAARAAELLPPPLAAAVRGLRRAFGDAERALASNRPADARRLLAPVVWLSPARLAGELSATREDASDVRRLLARLRSAVPTLRLSDREAAAFEEARAAAGAAGEVRRRLSARVDLRFENARFEEILLVLGTLGGTPMHVDAAAQERPELAYAVTFEARDRTLEDILSALAGQAGLDWSVTEQGIVRLSPKS